jgi:hypothetical protein
MADIWELPVLYTRSFVHSFLRDVFGSIPQLSKATFEARGERKFNYVPLKMSLVPRCCHINPTIFTHKILVQPVTHPKSPIKFVPANYPNDTHFEDRDADVPNHFLGPSRAENFQELPVWRGVHTE